MKNLNILWMMLLALGVAGCGGGSSSTTSNTSDLQNIFFTRYAVNDPHLYVMRENGTGMIPLDTSDTGSKSVAGVVGGRVIYQLFSLGNADIYSVKLDGTDRMPLAGDAASENIEHIGGDGRIIYSRNGEIFSIHADGTGLTTLANGNVGGYYNAVLSDGRVVYSMLSSLSAEWEIMVVNADGTGTVQVTDGSGANKTFLTVTPDDRIVYSQVTSTSRFPYPCELFIVKADGTSTVPLTNDPTTAKIFQGISPDGKVLYSIYTQTGLYAVNFDGSGTLNMTGSLTGTFTVKSFIAPNRVVFTRRTGTTLNQYDLYVVNTDGTGNAALAADGAVNEYFAVVTPAGRVIYTTGTTEYRGDIWSVKADGTGAVAIAADPAVDELYHGVTPDDRVVYEQWRGGLYSALSDGRETAVLDDDPTVSVWYGGTMTAQGRIIYMRYYEDPVSSDYIHDIAAVNADGTDRKVLTTTGDVNSIEAIY